MLIFPSSPAASFILPVQQDKTPTASPLLPEKWEEEEGWWGVVFLHRTAMQGESCTKKGNPQCTVRDNILLHVWPEKKKKKKTLKVPQLLKK